MCKRGFRNGWPTDFIRQLCEDGYRASLSYLTMQVEIDHGKVVPKEPSRLPEKGSGLLPILQPDDIGPSKLTPLQALDALQKHLQLDPTRAALWMADVREARR